MRQLDEELVRRLHARAGAERWNVSVDAFGAILLTSARREFGDSEPAGPQLERYFASLHLADLALACACADGNEQAWDAFVRDCRPPLYRAADALDRSGGAREIADSLYADLFGLRAKDGVRQSHLRYFHGRSSLTTWLRAALAQRYTDHRRSHARLEPLEEAEAVERGAAARDWSAGSRLFGFVAILRRVLSAVVAALPARDRLRVRCYYAQEMTLAQIGRMLSESEATASRSLARTRRSIRHEVERRLREEELMSEDDIADGFAAVVEDAGPLDVSDLLGEVPLPIEGRKKPVRDRSQ